MLGKQSAPPIGGYTPGRDAPTQQTVTGQFGAPPSSPTDLAGWADSVKHAYPGGVKTPYQQAAEAQASANRPNQNSPFGSLSWSQDPQGNWTENQSLAPGLQGAASGFMGELSGGAGADARQRTEDALYARSTSRLDPQWGQREQGMQQQLANSGLDITSEAGRRAQMLFGQQRNDAYGMARNDAIAGGGAEETRQRQNALAGLGGLQGLMGMPGFQAGPNYLGAAGMANQYGLDAAALNNQNWSDIMGGASRIGAAAAGK